MQDVHARAERGQAHIAWRGDASLAVYSGAMPLSSWLFIRDSESIWVERPYGSALIVAGPGAHREEREFIDEAALQAFQIALAEKLAAQGWFLWDHNRDRRTGSDRRGTPRPTADRRQPTGVRT